jgi:hypothetical protein
MRHPRRNFFSFAFVVTGAAVVTLAGCGSTTSVRTAAPVTTSIAPAAPAVSSAVTPPGSGVPISGADRTVPPVVQPTPVSGPNAVTPPASGAPIPGADRTAPAVAKPTNRNARNTPTSRLCWAQRETFLLLVNTMMSADAKGVVTAQLIPILDSVDLEIAGLQRGKADPLLAPFIDRFASDLKAARGVFTSKPLISSQDVVNSFDFENYPAVKEYVAAANRDPGCVDIT